MNALGSFIDSHTVNAMVATKQGNYTIFNNVTITGSNILISIGARPFIPKEPPELSKYCVTSDDLFQLENPPMKTLVIGAGCILLLKILILSCITILV